MIPEFNQSGVLPPFLPGTDPTNRYSTSPYPVTALQFVQKYATSTDRIAILKGLFQYREKLRNSGIVNGFQWIDGSFVEDVEKIRGRSPADIDLVTFAHRPLEHNNQSAWEEFFKNNLDLFKPDLTKSLFKCDAFYVDLSLAASHAEYIVDSTRYWFGLFSHQRESSLWKGMLQIEINCNDKEALKELAKQLLLISTKEDKSA